ncbi:MAG: ABC transporter permease [Fimbriimonadaceae bacterium]|nr:ABC transporter permease [Fimbriimonadaceae bacterium]
MWSWRHETRAAYAFVERNVHLVKRYWGWEVVWLIYSIANALSVTFIGAGMERISGQRVDTQHLILYLLTGTLVWGYLSVVFTLVSETIQWERWEGTIEYTLMAPISRFTHLVGTTLFSLLYGFLQTAVILAAVAACFHLDLSGANLLGAAGVLLAASLSFSALGMVGAVLPLLYPEKGVQVVQVIQSLLLVISGVYYPVDVLPRALCWLSQFSPATYVLQGMRAALLDGAPLRQLWPCILALLLLGMLLMPLGVWLFGKAERYARRTGRLKRDG